MRIRNRDSRELAKELAVKFNLISADNYDLVGGRLDGLLELIALIPSPLYDIKEFEGRETLFPLKWCTLSVLDPKTLSPV